MNSLLKKFCIPIAGVFFLQNFIFADEIRLLDSSVILGKITAVQNEIVYLTPSFSNKQIEINLKDVENIATDKPVFTTLKNGTTIFGTILPGFRNTINVSSTLGISIASTQEISHIWCEGDLSPSEKLLKQKDRYWTFLCEAGFTGNRGKNDTLNCLFGFSADNVGQYDKLNLFSRYKYSQTNNVESEENFHIGMDYSDKFYAPFSWYGRTDNGYDEILKQSFFSTSALGLSYWFIDKPDHALEFRLGGAFRYEAYEEAANIENTSTIAVDLSLNHTFKTDIGNVVSKINYSPSVEAFTDDYKISHETYFETAYYNNRVGVRFGIQNNYNSIVAVGNPHLESTIYIKLIYKIK